MKPIETVAIVGAGNMGSGIAQKTAQEQFPVQMVDREEQWVERGQNTITKLLGEAVERRIFSEAQVEEIHARITGVVGVENVAADTDLVIEAVFEDFDIKTAVFNTLDDPSRRYIILYAIFKFNFKQYIILRPHYLIHILLSYDYFIAKPLI